MRRLRLWVLLAYLALPFDLIPDFLLHMLGYADDAIIVTAVLRSVVRRAGSVRSESTGLVATTASLRCVASPAFNGLKREVHG